MKRCARIVVEGRHFSQTASMDFFRQLGWLDYDHRADYFTALTVHKALQKKQPEYLQIFAPPKHDHNTRSKARKNLCTQEGSVRTNNKLRKFSYRACKVWNTLPPELRDIENVSSFKPKLRSYLLNRQITL